MPSTIRQVIQEYSNGGGAETVAYELSKAFSHHGLVNEVRASHLKIAPPEGTTARPLAGCLASIATRAACATSAGSVMPLFSLATWINIRRQQGQIVISHGDCVNGDVMIIHAVNAASIEIKQHEGRLEMAAQPDALLGGAARSFHDPPLAFSPLCRRVEAREAGAATLLRVCRTSAFASSRMASTSIALRPS